MAAIIAFDLNTIDYAGGAIHDPVAALVFCTPQEVNFAMVNGKVLVQEGQPTTIELPRLVEEHNSAASTIGPRR
ncbi:MAG: hypothetical protein R2867_38160 [Caldilineaceae bacterium]